GEHRRDVRFVGLLRERGLACQPVVQGTLLDPFRRSCADAELVLAVRLRRLRAPAPPGAGGRPESGVARAGPAWHPQPDGLRVGCDELPDLPGSRGGPGHPRHSDARCCARMKSARSSRSCFSRLELNCATKRLRSRRTSPDSALTFPSPKTEMCRIPRQGTAGTSEG